MAGTDSMETMMRISALQPMSQDTISILDNAGSRGNSTIIRPVGVKEPKSMVIKSYIKNNLMFKVSYKLLFNQKPASMRSQHKMALYFFLSVYTREVNY